MSAGNWNADFLPRATLESLGFKALGRDVLVHSTCVLRNCARISLGDGVRVDPFTVVSVGGALEIGAFTHIAAHCLLTGAERIVIGAFSGLSHGGKILSATTDFSGGGLAPPMIPEEFRCDRAAPVRLGNHALIGANSVVLPGADLGDGATFGALALIKGRHDPWTLNAGAPAKKIGMRDRDSVLAAEKKFLESRR
jgi:galactoside O-acetyltransferase